MYQFINYERSIYEKECFQVAVDRIGRFVPAEWLFKKG